VFIVANAGAENIVGRGMVCKVSRSGMELYSRVNQRPGGMMEVEFRTPGTIRVAGVVRNRSGFCFGLEFRVVRAESEATPDLLESLLLQRHEAYLREAQQRSNQCLRIALEVRKLRQEIELFANASHSL
jgi:hypothetical protein